jgi:hypothetical protein
VVAAVMAHQQLESISSLSVGGGSLRQQSGGRPRHTLRAGRPARGSGVVGTRMSAAYIWQGIYPEGATRMTGAQLFVLFGLPLLIGGGGVLAAISFRRRLARQHAQANPAK